MDKVEKTEGCWVWKAGTNGNGYGIFWLIPSNRHRKGEREYAHRLMYRWHIGAIPGGYEIDHLCRNRSCVNPDHLEAVTRRVNQRRGFSVSGKNARKTHCVKGHPYDETNTYWYRGTRQCATCRSEYRDANRERQLEYQRRWRAENRDKMNAYRRRWRDKRRAAGLQT